MSKTIYATEINFRAFDRDATQYINTPNTPTHKEILQKVEEICCTGFTQKIIVSTCVVVKQVEMTYGEKGVIQEVKTVYQEPNE